MGALTQLIEQYRFNTGAMEHRVEGLDREKLLCRPDGRGNHMIWILGHIATSRGSILDLVRPGEATSLESDEQELFGMGSKIREEDVYPTTDRLLNRVRERGAALEEVLSGLSDEDANRPWEMDFPFGEKTPRGMLRFMFWHETYHVGELSYLAAWNGNPLGF
ncbi:MAG: DinB family protein [Planctomycetota bacterium]|jgi:uncharacterized damage-inducible protein DinB